MRHEELLRIWSEMTVDEKREIGSYLMGILRVIEPHMPADKRENLRGIIWSLATDTYDNLDTPTKH